jgi:hypothetical protein
MYHIISPKGFVKTKKKVNFILLFSRNTNVYVLTRDKYRLLNE